MTEDAAAPVQDSAEADEERFTAASNAVAAAASSGRLDNDALLHLYGLYKQATEGPCNTCRPSFLNQKARSKWCAHYTFGRRCTMHLLSSPESVVPKECCCSLRPQTRRRLLWRQGGMVRAWRAAELGGEEGVCVEGGAPAAGVGPGRGAGSQRPCRPCFQRARARRGGR